MARARSVRSLLAEIDDLPPGFARTAKAEEAVRAADAAGDLDAGFEARVALAEAAEHGGEAQKALVAVTWCLGRIDEHPGRFDVRSPYWALKWIPFTLLDLPTVPLAEVERVVGEVRRRYDAEGTGQDAVAKLAWTIPLQVGRVEEAVAAHRAWRMVPRTEYADCRACDVASEVDLAVAAGDPALALAHARPLLSGHLSCAEEPARVIGTLLAPLTELGDHAEAERLHGWGLRLSRGNPSLVATLAEHVLHMVRTGRLAAATDLVVELLGVCDRGLYDVSARLDVVAAAAGVAGALIDAGTEWVDRPWGERPRRITELHAALAAEARDVAAAFDRRNGTAVCSGRIHHMIAVRPLPGQTALVTVPATSGSTGAALSAPVPSTPAPARAEVSGAGQGATEDAQALLDIATNQPGLTDDELADLAGRAEAAFLRDDDPLGAARAGRLVGAALLRSGRVDEAVRVLTPAVESLTGDPGQQARAALHLAIAHIELEPTGSAADEWLSVAEGAAGRSAEPGVLRGRCLLTRTEWELSRAGEEAGPDVVGAACAGYARARELMAADPTEVAHAWAAESRCLAGADDLDGAVDAAATAWALLSPSDVDDALDIGGLYAGVLAAHEEWDRAARVLTDVRDRAVAAGARAAGGRVAMARTDLLIDASRTEDALASAWDAIDLFRSVGDHGATDGARLELARLLREMGRDADAHELLAELLSTAANEDDREFEGTIALDLALLELDYDVVEEGIGHAERALTCFSDDRAARARVHRGLAKLHAAAEDWEPALAAGDESILAFAAEDNPIGLADVRREQAERLVLAGRPEAGLGLYLTVRNAYAEAGLAVPAAAADLGRVDALAVLGRVDEAVALAEAVAEVGRAEEVPELEADALWSAATHRATDAASFDRALDAYARAGAPPEQLETLLAQRDAVLKKGRRSRWRR